MPDTAQPSRLVEPGAADVLDFPWGRLCWLLNAERLPDARQTFGVCEILPGHKNPRHFHPNCDEVLYVLEGELDHTLGEAVYHLTPGALLHIPADTPHDARNTGAGTARVVIAYSAADRQTVFLEPGGDY